MGTGDHQPRATPVIFGLRLPHWVSTICATLAVRPALSKTNTSMESACDKNYAMTWRDEESKRGEEKVGTA